MKENMYVIQDWADEKGISENQLNQLVIEYVSYISLKEILNSGDTGVDQIVYTVDYGHGLMMLIAENIPLSSMDNETSLDLH